MKIQKLFFILFILIISDVHCQNTCICDTVDKEKHVITLHCVDSAGNDFFRVSRPGCTLLGLDAPVNSDRGPIISICFPYDTAMYGRGSNDYGIASYSYGFIDDQIMVIIVDTTNHIDHLFDFDSILSEDDLSTFLEYIGGWIYLNEGPGEVLARLFSRTPRTQPGRTTMAIKGKYSQVLLYNIKNEELDDFIDSAKSLFVYELKRIQ